MSKTPADQTDAIVCCVQCGRDTKNKCQICTTCNQGRSNLPPERLDRKHLSKSEQRAIKLLGHTLELDQEGWSEYNAGDNYNGVDGYYERTRRDGYQ